MTRPTDKISRGRAKIDLPRKVCVSCSRPFTWRKKWERDWESVRYCSERCRRNKPAAGGATS